MTLRPHASKVKTALALALAGAVLVGCGGGGGGGDASSAATPTSPTDPTLPSVTTITAAGIVKYFTDLIAGTSEATEPTNANLVELAVDDRAEPAAL